MNLDRATTLIAGFEGFRSFVYDDTSWPSRKVGPDECRRSGGQWVVRSTGGIATLGYGETDADWIAARWSGTSEADARERLRLRVAEFAASVEAAIEAPMTDHQHEAMTSLAFNIGARGFANSTVRRRFNAGNVAGAAEAFRMWVRPASLRDRREAEIAHFLKTDQEAEMTADIANLHPVFRARVLAACRDYGTTVYSGARSARRQAELWEDFKAGRGNPANPPGRSWHEYGAGLVGGPHALAVDFAEPYPHGAPGLIFPVRSEPWHAQPSEVPETARTADAHLRLPAEPEPGPIITNPEDIMSKFDRFTYGAGNQRWLWDSVARIHVHIPGADALALVNAAAVPFIGDFAPGAHEFMADLSKRAGFACQLKTER